MLKPHRREVIAWAHPRERAWEGRRGGVLKLEKPIDLKEKSKVQVIIETEPEATSAVEDEDPTGWKAVRQFIGMWKDAPARSSASLSEDHDRVIYRNK